MPRSAANVKPGVGVAKRSSLAGVPAAHRAAMCAGTAESVNLADMLTIDFAVLMKAVAPFVSAGDLARLDEAAQLGITRRMDLAGRILAGYPHKLVRPLARSLSDTARGWACYAMVRGEGLSLEARLELVRPFADDPHMGVREWAWMAIRPHLAADIRQALALLTPWTASPSAAIRRFATESTRPRGVWTTMIPELVDEPSIGLPLLEPLCGDPAKYVQDSVANWLNDASKSKPAWVKSVCDRWMRESSGTETKRICGRALRTIMKRGGDKGRKGAKHTDRAAKSGRTR